MSVFRRLLMLSGGGTSVPYDYPDKFAFFADSAVVEPSVLEVLRPSDRLGDFTVVRDSSATYVDSDGIIKEASQLGDELVTNGDFDTDLSGWDIVDPAVTWSSSYGGSADFTQPATVVDCRLLNTDFLTLGKLYILSFEVKELINTTKFNYLNGSGYISNDVVLGVNEFIFEGLGTTFALTSTVTNSTIIIDNISVKEVSYDMARIDYTNGVAELLTEPQSTNLIAYSEDFSQGWYVEDGTLSSNLDINPKGEAGAFTLTATTGDPYMSSTEYSAQSTDTFTGSIWAKGVGSTVGKTCKMYIVRDGYAEFNSVEFTLTNEWERFTHSFTFSQNPASDVAIRFDAPSDGYVNGDQVLVWGAQLEELPYATSYIPTNGSSVTRLQDEITDGGNVNVINSEEGVLFFEGSALYNDTVNYRRIAILNTSGDSYVSFTYWVDGRIQVEVLSGGVSQSGAYVNVTSQMDNIKLAIKWKLNDFSSWINGVEVLTDNTGISPLDLNRISFLNRHGAQWFFGRTRELKVYNKALPDSQLEYITTL